MAVEVSHIGAVALCNWNRMAIFRRLESVSLVDLTDTAIDLS